MNLIKWKELKVNRKNVGHDSIAGLTKAVAAIPHGIANAVLAGVNPIHGLYSLTIATPIGALTTSSVYMNLSITGAMALTVGDSLTGLSGDARFQALIMLTLLVGIFQLILGLLRFGDMARFISNAVMTGFLAGLALLIILGQLGHLTGYHSGESNQALQAVDLLRHLGQIHLPSLIIGVATIVLIIALRYTPLSKADLILPLIIAAVGVPLLGWDSVRLVGDTSSFPRSFVLPVLPNLSLIPDLIFPAMAVAIIGLVQSAGISYSYPNPDGKYPHNSEDFAGQGIANIAASFVRGMPAGGSLSGTAIIVNAGAKSRWANIFAGLFVVVAVLLFSNAVGLLPMPAVAGLLIVIGYRIVDFGKIRTVWHTHRIQIIVMVLTFVSTLVLRLAEAVFLGMAASIFLYAFRSSSRTIVKELVLTERGFFEEHSVPAEVPSNKVTILNVYGSLFFAAVPLFKDSLPKVKEAKHAVVILDLRGRRDVGSTFMNVIENYKETLEANNCKLILSEVSGSLRRQLLRTGLAEIIGDENIFMASRKIGFSSAEALEAANKWLKN